ncbi:MAG: MBL fold metallo-hydrolase [Archaeoglobaceae archaeon]|nr:MBL fold metallo-hydrolase [Archaeoglobaceae archaeon]MDW7989064.1 MBL fold metallo-hydrolase [Archaeoglobaceae archaeon]
MRVSEKVYLIDSFDIPGIFSTYFLDFKKKVLVEPCVVSGVKRILDYLSKFDVRKLDYIAVTHVHVDHGGSAATIAKILNSKILVHPKGLKHIANPEKLWQASKAVLGELAEIYGKPESIEEEKLIAVEDLQSFDLGDDELITIHAPGHAPHMVAYYLKKRKILFPSDSIGMHLKGKTFPLTPPPFDFEKAIETLERFEKLEVEIVALTHFGVTSRNCIREVKDRLKLWFEIARETKSIEELDTKLREVDKDINLIDKNTQFYSFYFTSLNGLISAVKSF